MVILMLGIGYIFTSTTTTVHMAQAGMGLNASIRGAEGPLRDDVRTISREGFLCLVEAGTDGSGNPTPPMLMFTATRDFRSMCMYVPPGSTAPAKANAAVVTYVPCLDVQTPGRPSVLGRFAYLLRSDEQASDLHLAALAALGTEGINNLRGHDSIGWGLADVAGMFRALGHQIRRPVEQSLRLVDLPAGQRVYDLNSAPGSLKDVDDLWPYMIAGCNGFTVEFCDGNRADNTTPGINQHNEQMVWLTPSAVINADSSLPPAKKRYQPGNVITGHIGDPNTGPGYILWTCRNKADWPKAIRLSLQMQDAAKRLAPQDYEIILNLPGNAPIPLGG